MDSIAANGVPIFRETIARYRVVASRKKKTKRNRSVGVGTENTDPGVAGRFEIENTNADQWPSRRRAGPSAPTSGRRRGGGAKAGAGRGLGRRGEGRQLLRRSAQKLPRRRRRADVCGALSTSLFFFVIVLFCFFVFEFGFFGDSVERSQIRLGNVGAPAQRRRVRLLEAGGRPPVRPLRHQRHPSSTFR